MTESLPPPPYAVSDLVTTAIPDDERLWVPQAPNIWFRPLLLNTVQGEWVNLLRVRRSGVLSRHRHPAPVHGYVIKGTWRYLEHNWIAKAGDYVFEPPGEVQHADGGFRRRDDHAVPRLRRADLLQRPTPSLRLRRRPHQE